ncbi:MAG: efflux RND transporter periplasmic adaptor subunit [Pseudomonadota bacterium]
MKFFAYGAIALLVAAGAATILQSPKVVSAEAKVTGPAPKPQTVSVARAKTSQVQDTFEAYGDLAPIRTVDVSPQITGHVRRIYVSSGQFVEKDEILIELDTTVPDAELSAAKAQLASAEADLRRKTTLAKDGNVTNVALDLAELNVQVARADVAVKSAKRALHTVRAPFAGQLTQISISEGAFVSAGQVLFKLQDESQLRVDFSVAERLWSKLKVGQKVSIKTDNRSGTNVDGKLTYIAPVADANSRSLAVNGLIDNEHRSLVGGLFVEVSVKLGARDDVLVVPTTAVLQELSGSYVFVVEQGKVHRRKVVLGERYGKTVEIKTGLGSGSSVVVGGQDRLRDAMPVTVAVRG